MKEREKFEYAMRNTQVLRPPQRSLATFGTTNIYYYLVAELLDRVNKIRIREGRVSAERPKIIFPQDLADIFEGFGEEAKRYAQMLLRRPEFGYRVLEYRFKNEPIRMAIKSGHLDSIIARINEMVDRKGAKLTAIIRGVDDAWQVSLMKFIAQTVTKSSYINIQELEERGFFDREGGAFRETRREIEELFRQAKRDKSKISELAVKLNEFGLFKEYEDRFFRLLSKK